MLLLLQDAFSTATASSVEPLPHRGVLSYSKNVFRSLSSLVLRGHRVDRRKQIVRGTYTIITDPRYRSTLPHLDPDVVSARSLTLVARVWILVG